MSKPIAMDLSPLNATCANCEGPLTIYSYPLPRGTAHCAACSPSWLLGDSRRRVVENGARMRGVG